MENIGFSVIIPTLHEEHHLPDLLASLAKQSYRGFEVIVVDASTNEKTRNSAKAFAEDLPKLTVLTSTKKNVSHQRNTGAQHAQEEYLVFFDADVVIPRSFLKKIRSTIKKRRTMLLTTWLSPNTRDEQDKIICTVTNLGIEAARRLDRPFAAGCDIIIKKSLFDHVGQFNSKLAMSEDHDLVQRCSKAGVKLTILRNPKLVMSMRRFRRYGYFSIIRTYAKTWVYMVLKKSITKAMVDYPMGGKIYQKDPKRRRRYLEKFENKIIEILETVLTA